MCKGTKKKKSAESNKQDDCYLVLLLKVQYGSNYFWIFWEALSLDYRPNGTTMQLMQITDIKQRKTGVDTLT